MTKEAADVGRCVQRESNPVRLQGGRKFSNICLLDDGHPGNHNYHKPLKDDEVMVRRFLNNRSERGMM